MQTPVVPTHKNSMCVCLCTDPAAFNWMDRSLVTTSGLNFTVIYIARYVTTSEDHLRLILSALDHL